MTKRGFIYLNAPCPVCEKRIRAPFSRTSGPVPYLHHNSHSSKPACRLIVTPDPIGEAHSVVVVPPDTSIESALEEALAA